MDHCDTVMNPDVVLRCPLSCSLLFSSARGTGALTRYNASVLLPKIPLPRISWISHDHWRGMSQLCPVIPNNYIFPFSFLSSSNITSVLGVDESTCPSACWLSVLGYKFQGCGVICSPVESLSVFGGKTEAGCSLLVCDNSVVSGAWAWTGGCCPLLVPSFTPKWMHEHTPNSCLKVIETEWSHAWRHIF